MNVATVEPVEPAQTIDEISSETTKPKKHWQAGTLTYTFGGIVFLFFWLLLGDFAWSLKERSVYNVVQLLFKTFGASDTMNALCMGTLPCVIGLFLVPMISYHSDLKRGSWGRRIPYLLITTPIASLSMIGLAFSPIMGGALHRLLGTSSPGLNENILVFMTIFWIIFEVGTIAANSIFTALINDVVPDKLVGRFYGLFRMFSLLAGIIFNFWLLGKAEKHYVLMFSIIGIIYGFGFFLMCLKVKEGEYPPPPRNDGGAFGGIKTYFKDCFSYSYYCWIFIFLTLAMLTFIPVNLFNIFYAQSLNISMDDYGRLIAITFVISLLSSWFLGALADRIHPIRLGVAVLTLYVFVALLSGIFITDKKTFGIALISHCVISGMYFTGTASLMQRLFPKARFAQLASASGIIGSVITIIVTPMIGGILDISNHCYRLTYFMGAVFAVLSLLIAIPMYRKFIVLGGDNNYKAP